MCCSDVVLSSIVVAGHRCEQYNNPADFLLKLILENEEQNDTKSKVL